MEDAFRRSIKTVLPFFLDKFLGVVGALRCHMIHLGHVTRVKIRYIVSSYIVVWVGYKRCYQHLSSCDFAGLNWSSTRLLWVSEMVKNQ